MKKWASGSTPDKHYREGRSRIRVRYAETDAMGWVYYATYLCYFEVGRTEMIREIWRPYRQIEEEGLRLPVIEAGCRYLSGARYDDELEITTRLTLPSGARVRFDYVICRLSDTTEIARGFTEHCFVSIDGQVARIPDEVRMLVVR